MSAPGASSSVPRQVVMIIRHGEKPGGKSDPGGVRLDGSEHKGSLTPWGWGRAGALVRLFAPDAATGLRDGLHRPVSLIASNREGPKGGSHRQEETLCFLADRLDLEINLDHGVGEEAALAKTLADLPSPVLICWEHKQLPVLASLLGPASSPVPSKWPSDRFDLVWVFTRSGPDQAWAFTQVPELVMPGDSAELID